MEHASAEQTQRALEEALRVEGQEHFHPKGTAASLSCISFFFCWPLSAKYSATVVGGFLVLYFCRVYLP